MENYHSTRLELIKTINICERLESEYFLRHEYAKAKRTRTTIDFLIEVLASIPQCDSVLDAMKMYQAQSLARYLLDDPEIVNQVTQ